jgi:hypothetical protein
MKRPRVLTVAEPLPWSPGLGTDVWQMFRGCIDGDLDAVQRLLRKDRRWSAVIMRIARPCISRFARTRWRSSSTCSTKAPTR